MARRGYRYPEISFLIQLAVCVDHCTRILQSHVHAAILSGFCRHEIPFLGNSWRRDRFPFYAQYQVQSAARISWSVWQLTHQFGRSRSLLRDAMLTHTEAVYPFVVSLELFCSVVTRAGPSEPTNGQTKESKGKSVMRLVFVTLSVGRVPCLYWVGCLERAWPTTHRRHNVYQMSLSRLMHFSAWLSVLWTR